MGKLKNTCIQISYSVRKGDNETFVNSENLHNRYTQVKRLSLFSLFYMTIPTNKFVNTIHLDGRRRRQKHVFNRTVGAGLTGSRYNVESLL